jgi:hypothetical protein
MWPVMGNTKAPPHCLAAFISALFHRWILGPLSVTPFTKVISSTSIAFLLTTPDQHTEPHVDSCLTCNMSWPYSSSWRWHLFQIDPSPD